MENTQDLVELCYLIHHGNASNLLAHIKTQLSMLNL